MNCCWNSVVVARAAPSPGRRGPGRPRRPRRRPAPRPAARRPRGAAPRSGRAGWPRRRARGPRSCCPTARRPARTRGPAGGGPCQDVVRAQLRHRHPAGAQEGMRRQQVVARPLRDAHDGVRLPVADGVADPAQQAPPGENCCGPELVAEVEGDDGPGAGERRHGGGGRHPQHGVGPAAGGTGRAPAMSMAPRREPPTGCTCTPSGTSSSTPERTTRCSSSSRPRPTTP